jgi:hypothetical protein
MRSLKNLMPSSKKMKIISLLLSLLLLASVNEAMAEHWELIEKGDYIELYNDSDYYHQNQENGLEHWRLKHVFNDGSTLIQRYEVNPKTGKYRKI